MSVRKMLLEILVERDLFFNFVQKSQSAMFLSTSRRTALRIEDGPSSILNAILRRAPLSPSFSRNAFCRSCSDTANYPSEYACEISGLTSC